MDKSPQRTLSQMVINSKLDVLKNKKMCRRALQRFLNYIFIYIYIYIHNAIMDKRNSVLDIDCASMISIIKW